MLAHRVYRKEKQEHDIDRPRVDRLEIDRLVQAGENAERCRQPLNTGGLGGFMG
jgi:hypothetical protein